MFDDVLGETEGAHSADWYIIKKRIDMKFQYNKLLIILKVFGEIHTNVSHVAKTCATKFWDICAEFH
jgi:hypothetical protein